MYGFSSALADIPESIWRVLLEAAPYALVGFLAAGLLKAFLPKGLVARHLGGTGLMSIVKASVLGAPLPLCSCGVLPAAAELRKSGASKGATAAFLTATPETGVDSVAVTYGMLDPVMTVVRLLAAIFSAVAAGVFVSLSTRGKLAPPAMKKLEPLSPNPSSGCCEEGCGCEESVESKTFWGRFRDGVAYAMGELMGDVGLWLMFGVLLAGVVTAVVPDGLIEQYLGSGVGAMLAALALSTPLYVCATASTPLAAALAAKGLSPGAALVLLLAGPATNAAALTVAGKILGPRGLAAYLTALVLASLGLGLATDALYLHLGLSTLHWGGFQPQEHASYVSIACAVILPFLVARAFVLAHRRGGKDCCNDHGETATRCSRCG
jgi:hypothetical protein